VRLTIVGCAGSAPAADSACSCYLVETDDYRLLLDLGAGAAGPLQRYVDPAAVDAVILSHAHSDHHADITQLWRLRAASDAPPLPIVGPSDMPAPLLSDPEAFDPTFARPGRMTLGPFDIRLAQVEHGECWATRIGDALCYTADTGPCAAIDELAEGCRVLLAEASGFAAEGPSPGHLSARDAGLLAHRSGAQLLVLTHLRPWHDHRQLLEEANAVAGCPVILAHPGLRIAL
jgi:ribonuclease BN (tRNA processing enzyme)